METSRREFLKYIGAVIATPTISSLPGCSREESGSREISLGDRTYSIQDGVLTQTGGEGSKLGVLADPHGHEKNANFFVEELMNSVDAFIMPGDLSHSFGDREGLRDDDQEIRRVIAPVAATRKLVLIFPGNHEPRDIYRKTLDDMAKQYDNVVDMTRVPVADFSGMTIVGMGGNNNARFCIPGGFLRSTEEFEEFGRLAHKHRGNKPLLMATHIPRRYWTERGLDLTDGGVHAGGIALERVRKALDSMYGVNGHIHEAYGMITHDEEPVRPGELVHSLDFNPGAVYDHLEGKRERKVTSSQP